MQHVRRAATTAGGFLGCVVVTIGFFITALIVCGCFWMVVWPVNYFGCGTERPAGITTIDLIGVYVSDDGVQLDLERGGALTVSNMDKLDAFQADPPLSGTGTWTLQPEGAGFDDIRISLHSAAEGEGGYATGLSIAGSREEPWLYKHLGDPDSCDLYRFDRA